MNARRTAWRRWLGASVVLLAGAFGCQSQPKNEPAALTGEPRAEKNDDGRKLVSQRDSRGHIRHRTERE